MQCPVCKISTLIRTRGDAVVTVCRNKRCKNYNKMVTVLEKASSPSEAPAETSEETKEKND